MIGKIPRMYARAVGFVPYCSDLFLFCSIPRRIHPESHYLLCLFHVSILQHCEGCAENLYTLHTRVVIDVCSIPYFPNFFNNKKTKMGMAIDRTA